MRMVLVRSPGSSCVKSGRTSHVTVGQVPAWGVVYCSMETSVRQVSESRWAVTFATSLLPRSTAVTATVRSCSVVLATRAWSAAAGTAREWSQAAQTSVAASKSISAVAASNPPAARLRDTSMFTSRQRD